MKREELTPIELECNMGPDVNGVVQREPWKAYDIDEVNILLDQYEEEISTLKARLEDRGCPELHAHKADVQIPVYGSIADADVYLKDKVDAILDKKNKALEYAQKLTLINIEIINKQKAEIAELKAKLENVQNSMYCDVVYANMKIRKLSRALWLARYLFNGRSSEYFSGMASRCKIGQEDFYEKVDKAKRYLKAAYKCQAMAEKFK